jgi:oxygen-dependent protoporphyrinogen oxidase
VEPRAQSAPRTCAAVVVGGGIAGLVAAWRLRAHDVMLLEAADRVGGRTRSERRGEYWLNLAAHIFPPPDSDLGRVVSELGLETVPIPGTGMAAFLNDRLVLGGRLATYPLRLATTAAGRVSFARVGRRLGRAVREYLELAQWRADDTPAARRSRLLAYRDDQTFPEFIGPTDPDVDALMRAAIRRVSAEPEALAAGAGVAQFAATFNGAASVFQRNLPGGTSVLTQRLHAELGARVLTGATVTSVANSAAGVAVRFQRDGSERAIEAAAAIVATPAYVARRIVAGLDDEHASALDAIRYGPYVVTALLTNERGPMPWDGIYAMAVARKSFNMFFNTANVLREGSRRAPGGSLTVYGAASLGRALDDASDERVTSKFLGDLHAVFPETRRIVDEVVVQRWEHGIPYSVPGRSAHQRPLEEPLGRIWFTGDYVGERGGMDTAATSGCEAASAVESLLRRNRIRSPRGGGSLLQPKEEGKSETQN